MNLLDHHTPPSGLSRPSTLLPTPSPRGLLHCWLPSILDYWSSAAMLARPMFASLVGCGPVFATIYLICHTLRRPERVLMLWSKELWSLLWRSWRPRLDKSECGSDEVPKEILTTLV